MLYHSHSYQDPDTGEIVDVIVDDEPEYRNAGRDHRADVPRSTAPPRHPGHPGNLAPRPQHGSTGIPARVIVRNPARPLPGQGPGYNAGEYFAIKKSAIADVIPAVGQVWASFLGRPAMPQAVGDDVIDRNNAALHRDALAKHQQNQTRITALTDLAARAARLLLG